MARVPDRRRPIPLGRRGSVGRTPGRPTCYHRRAVPRMAAAFPQPRYAWTEQELHASSCLGGLRGRLLVQRDLDVRLHAHLHHQHGGAAPRRRSLRRRPDPEEREDEGLRLPQLPGRRVEADVRARQDARVRAHQRRRTRRARRRVESVAGQDGGLRAFALLRHCQLHADHVKPRQQHLLARRAHQTHGELVDRVALHGGREVVDAVLSRQSSDSTIAPVDDRVTALFDDAHPELLPGYRLASAPAVDLPDADTQRVGQVGRGLVRALQQGRHREWEAVDARRRATRAVRRRRWLDHYARPGVVGRREVPLCAGE